MSKLIVFAGQSLVIDLFTYSVSPPTAPEGCYLWSPDTNSWGPVTGNGAIEFAKRIRQNFNEDIYLINAAWGGSPLLELAGASTPNYNWSYAGSDGIRAKMMAQISACGMVPDLIIWWQGWGDYFSSRSNLQGDYYNGLSTLYSFIQSTLGLTAAQLPFIVWPSGKADYPPPAGTSSPYVIWAQITWAIETTGAMLGPACYDLPTRDGTHGTVQFYETMARRGAIGVLHRFDPANWPRPGHGPRILSATRYEDGSGSSTVVLETDAAILWPSDMRGNPSWIDGFRVYKDDSGVPGNQAQIVGVYPVGNKIRLTVGWDSRLYVALQKDCTENWGRNLYDDNDPFGTGCGLPLTPLPIPMST